jgi:hypothetical protein
MVRDNLFGDTVSMVPYTDKPIYKAVVRDGYLDITYIDFHILERKTIRIDETKRTYPNHRLEARLERRTDYGPQETD